MHYTTTWLKKKKFKLAVIGCRKNIQAIIKSLLTGILTPLSSPYTVISVRFHLMPQHFAHTSAYWKTYTELLSLRSQEEQ